MAEQATGELHERSMTLPPDKHGRFELSLDGSHACALYGPDLQAGEAEFAPIEGWPNATYKQERAAMSAAYEALAARLGKRLPFDIVHFHEQSSAPSSIAPMKITQTVMGKYGNCQSACLAMMLGVPLESVPNFAQLAQDTGDSEAYAAQGAWLRERGWGILTVVKWQSLPWPPRHGYFIAGGPSPRGHRHAVIYKDGELWHDPHPEGGGISEVQDIDFLYPLNPVAPVSAIVPSHDDLIRNARSWAWAAEFEQSSGAFLAAQLFAKEVLRLNGTSDDTAKVYPHKWDRDGERCTVCGQKDWMGGGCREP